MIKHIFVWMRRPEGPIRLVGELATTAPDRNSGRFESEFEYTRAWVDEAGAFALDPVSLPLDAALRFEHSAAPADDVAALYRHMVFNAAIGNVDDHLKNFWMLARRRVIGMELN